MAAIGGVSLRLVGSHVGVSIGEDGPSQMGLEDIAIMRAIPNSVVLYPSDAVSTYYLTQDMYDYTGGVSYMRTTRGETPIIYPASTIFKIGGLHEVRYSENDRVCIVAAGITLHEAIRAHQLLKSNHRVDVSVVDLYSVKPLDRTTLLERARKSCNRILVVEDHYQQGGIYEAVCAELVNYALLIQSLAVKEVPRSGPPHALMKMHGIDAEGIVTKVLGMIQAA
jgi:transketolase